MEECSHLSSGEEAAVAPVRSQKIGFIGLGHMGEPMARNLANAGILLAVWNRSEAATHWFREHHVEVSERPEDLFNSCSVAILMLANSQAIDKVLGRGTAQFPLRVGGKTIINMGTVAPGFSAALAADIRASGGRFVECPVSGSRVPAEEGELVAMLAGDPDGVEEAKTLIGPMCGRSFACGEVPAALMMKLAVNHFLITMVTGLVEATHFAQCNELDVELFRDVIGSGPMGSKVSSAKLDKIVNTDLSAQASLRDVLMNTELIVEQATKVQVAAPLLQQCLYLYREAEGLGLGGSDMIGVLAALESLTEIDRSIVASQN
jgi:3-hydroxyisobutyrate dehydrogenase